MSDAAWILTSSTAAVAVAGTALLVWASGHWGARRSRRGGPGGEARPPEGKRAHPAIPVVQRAHLEAHLAALEGGPITVFYIGLDGMKFVNRHYGHALGDRLLLATGERLQALKHAPDGIAHIGGDEFAVFVAQPVDSQRIHEIVWDILDTVVQPHEFGEVQVGVSCSVGICSHPQHGPVHQLLVHAHAAMCTAKARGRGSFAFHADAGESPRGRARDIERHLRAAVAHQEFHLAFQPKVEVASGRATAAEALIRWQHPELGTVPPDIFLPIAERLGLGSAIGEWVLDEACRHARAWRGHGLEMRLAVNLSARQLLQPHLVRQILAILEHHGLPPASLTCEITEPLAIENIKASAQVLDDLRQAGVHLAIDEFGTGHANLGYLRRLPVHELKIDRSLVRELGACAQADAIVEAVVAMAHALGKRVVAEGIENDAQLGVLRRLGCDEVQGYLFSGPVAPPALLAWALANAKDRPAAAGEAADRPGRDGPLGPPLPGGA